jgi:hypothetical protein
MPTKRLSIDGSDVNKSAAKVLDAYRRQQGTARDAMMMRAKGIKLIKQV